MCERVGGRSAEDMIKEQTWKVLKCQKGRDGERKLEGMCEAVNGCIVEDMVKGQI